MLSSNLVPRVGSWHENSSVQSVDSCSIYNIVEGIQLQPYCMSLTAVEPYIKSGGLLPWQSSGLYAQYRHTQTRLWHIKPRCGFWVNAWLYRAYRLL